MNFKQILPYKLRRALTIGAIAGGTLTACEKNNEPPVIINPTRDVNVEFIGDKGVNIETVNLYAKDPDIRHIYIIPVGDFEVFSTGFIKLARTHLEKDIILIAPTKISGNGVDGFKFGRGCVTTEDSIWFEKHKWPVNRDTKQR